MLFIETKTRKLTWHVGEPFPRLDITPQNSLKGDGRVIQFAADGDELEFLQAAIEAGCALWKNGATLRYDGQ